MKKSLLILLLILSVNVGWSQPYSVGHTTITFNDPSRSGGFGNGGGSGRQIQTEIYYPSNSSGTNVILASGEFPIVVFGHGFAMAWDAYSNLWNDLVEEGYIIAFPRTEGSLLPAPNHNDFGLDLALVEVKMQALNNDVSSIFHQGIQAKSALIGHSMGGGACVLGAASSSSSTLVTYIGLAPAETNPSAASAAVNVNLESVIFSGSSDGVTPPNDHHIPIYNSLNSSCKTFISINDGSHCYFANPNFNCDFGELVSGTGSLSRGDQQAITSQYLKLWLDYKLRDNCAALTSFQNVLANSTQIVSTSNCGAYAVSTSWIDSTICFGDTLLFNSEFYYNSGLYYDTIYNHFGCDSVQFVIDLNILPKDSSFFIQYSCSPADTGVITQIFSSQFLCDSIVTHKTLLANYSTSQYTISACDSILLNSSVYYTSEDFFDTIPNGSVNGCDSIIEYNLVVYPLDSILMEVMICPNEVFLLPDGNITSNQGIYSYSHQNLYGCDSVYSLEISIETDTISDFSLDYNLVNDTVMIFLNPTILTFDSLNWDHDLTSDFLFSNNDTAYFLLNGNNLYNFEAVVYKNSCSKRNQRVVIISANSPRKKEAFKVYTNPKQGNIRIHSEKIITNWTLYNTLGKKVLCGTSKDSELNLNLESLKKGVYLIETNLGVLKIVRD